MTTRKIQGSWYVDLYLTIPGEGRRRIRRKSPINTKRGAERYEQTLVEELIWSSSPKSETETPDRRFDEFAVEFLTNYVDPRLKYSSKVTYRSAMQVHLVPHFGATPLGAIDAAAIAALQAKLLDGGRRSRKTVRNIVAVLTKALRVAAEWKYIDEVPSVERLRAPKPGFRFLSTEEVHALEVATAPQWRAMIRVALRTGLRLGELRALTWRQVLADQHVILVDRAAWRTVVSLPKHDRVRQVPVTDQTLELLAGLPSAASRTGLVFPKLDGTMLGQHWACEVLYKYSDRAGIGRIGWHVLRHTFATQLVAAGVPIPVIAELLGHANVSTTLRYAHVMPGAGAQAVAALDAWVDAHGHHLGTRDPGGPGGDTT